MLDLVSPHFKKVYRKPNGEETLIGVKITISII